MEQAAKVAGGLLVFVILVIIIEGVRDAARRELQIDPVSRISNWLTLPPRTGGSGGSA